MSSANREALLADPAFFIAHYFPDAIDERLEDYHLRLVDTATNETRGLILYPAGHGKTTLVSTLLPIWALCKDPNVRLGIIAKNDTEAKAIARAIHAQLAGNDELLQDFGPFKPEGDDTKPWALEALSIAKRTLRAKEPTIAFFGSGSKNVLGHRTDWTICDDVVTDKNSATPEQREKSRTWFNQSVDTMSRLPNSRVTVVGTLFDPEDLYNDLMLLFYPDDGLPIWTVQREDAIVSEETHESLWPARWPWKMLMAKKAAMGTLDFNKRYRNIAVDKSRQVFKEEYVKGGYIGKQRYDGCLDRGYVVGDYQDNWYRFGGFDPAIGGSRHAKFCAHIVLAAGSCAAHERCLWVVDLEREQMSLIQQVDSIIERHARYDCFVTRVEANSYQAGLLEAIQHRTTEQGLAYRIEPHYTNRQNKPDPELGVQAMSPFFENGLVHIPWGNPESMRKMQFLVDELIQYPAGRTTDTVMSFWFAWRASQEAAPKFKSWNRLHKPVETMWGRKTRRRTIKNPAYA